MKKRIAKKKNRHYNIYKGGSFSGSISATQGSLLIKSSEDLPSIDLDRTLR